MKIIMILSRIFILVIAFELLKVIVKMGEKEPEKEEIIPEEQSLSYNMLMKREQVRKLLNSLVQTGDTPIKEWHFSSNNEKDILMKLNGRSYFVKGKIKYEFGSCPRIISIKYKGGEIEGTKKKEFTEEQFFFNFKKELQSPDKLAYFEERMSELLTGDKEETEFNILDYEGITEEEFNGVFQGKRLNSFLKVVSEHFEIIEMQGPILKIKELDL